MTIDRKRILYLLMGAIAGLLAMGGIEAVLLAEPGSYLLSAMLQGAVLGGSFGLIFGFTDGFLYRELGPALPTAVLTAAAGALGGMAAMLVSARLALLLAGLFEGGGSANQLILLGVSRGAGWMLPGAIIGALEGLRYRSVKRSLAGLLGGMLGGLLGGLSLELLLAAFPGAAAAKLGGFLVLGLMIGFFLGEFERRFAYARLRVLSGPNKNREFLLSDRRTRLGSGLTDRVRLVRYRDVEIDHCGIERRGVDMVLIPRGDCRVNDRPVAGEQQLKYWDVIDIGKARLLLLGQS